MGKIRVEELALQMGIGSKEVLFLLQSIVYLGHFGFWINTTLLGMSVHRSQARTDT